MAISRTRFLPARAAAATALATAAMTAGLVAPAHADPRVFTARVNIDNQTSETFNLVSYVVTEGKSETGPLSSVSPNSTDWLKTAADEDQGGTSGHVKYKPTGGGQIVIKWNHPYEDSNTYECHVPEGLSCSVTDDDKYETEMTFTITAD